MKNIFFKLMLFIAGSASIMSCKKVNDWAVDPSHERLFKSLVFESSKIGSTKIEIRYTKAVNADKYIFEFSKDSLEFSNIVKTVEILADTLTPFASSPTPMKVEYRTIFDELDGTSGYSVRMASVDTVTGIRSGFRELYFVTAAEQLFTTYNTFTDRIIVNWTPSDRVTKIIVTNPLTNEVIQEKILSASEKAEGRALLENLASGTSYSISILNNDIVRGVMNLRTAGLAGGFVIPVNPGDNIPSLISDAVTQGKNNIILEFTGGETYTLGTLTLPAGVANISFTGNIDPTAGMPVLSLNEVRLTDPIVGKMLFENLVTAGSNSILFNMATDNVQIDEFSFVNTRLANYRSVVRLQNKIITAKKISFDYCNLNNIGDYGVINIGSNLVKVDTISIKRSTLVNLTTQLMDVRTNVGYIYIGNSTFYNQTKALTQLMRFDTGAGKLPLQVVTQANIISGSNAGAKIRALSFDMSKFSLNVSFGGSYRTNELIIDQPIYEFSGVTIFNGTASDLFVNPDGYDFRVKPESGFGGRGTVGDPRWF